jgi:pectate lyase
MSLLPFVPGLQPLAVDRRSGTCQVPFQLAALLLFLPSLLFAATNPSGTWETPPGWTTTRGGDGGKVFRVTTLKARGPGSLGEALAASGARRIEFAVSGNIDLDGRSLVVSQPFVTIAGETAPSPGITLRNGGMNINTHDVIVRHIRIRPGAGTRAKKSGWEVDGLATGGAHDVIIDHCSLNWSTDENLSASGPRFNGATPDEWRKNTSHRITFSHCIVGEGLHDSAHGKGPHSMGSLIHDNATEIAIIGNLYISNNARNPLFKGGARGAVINNLIQNPGNRFVTYGLVPTEWIGHAWERGALVVVGNVARKGQSTVDGTTFLDVRGPLDAFLDDNLFFDAKGASLPVTTTFRDPQINLASPNPTPDYKLADKPMFWPPRLQAKPAKDTKEWVLANAGARPWERDATDQRLIHEARTGGGKIIHYESEVEGTR